MTQAGTHGRRQSNAGYFVGVGFLVVAGGVFLLGPKVEIPEASPASVLPADIDPGPFRAMLTDPPAIQSATFSQRCNDCHALFTNVREPGRALTQHTEIELAHGLNDRCLNCHDHGDREKLALRGGETVGYDHVEQLCAQCHGPVFRDWGKGTHGKTLGYWNTELGEPTKLSCTQCHDPHKPAYAPMAPLPGPNTLRMGEQRAAHHGEVTNPKNPLMQWRSAVPGHAADHEQTGDHE